MHLGNSLLARMVKLVNTSFHHSRTFLFIVEVFMVYENVVRVSTNISKYDGRVRCVLYFSDKTHKRMSYPKYLMECHLGR